MLSRNWNFVRYTIGCAKNEFLLDFWILVHLVNIFFFCIFVDQFQILLNKFILSKLVDKIHYSNWKKYFLFIFGYNLTFQKVLTGMTSFELRHMFTIRCQTVPESVLKGRKNRICELLLNIVSNENLIAPIHWMFIMRIVGIWCIMPSYSPYIFGCGIRNYDVPIKEKTVIAICQA